MYDLPYFKEKNEKVIRDFIDQHPFAFITGCDQKNRPVATQIPIFLEQENNKLILRGHMMKNTDHHNAFQKNSNVLVVFTGSHTYVSASWYSEPNQASTWNYMSVHARGTLRLLGDEALVSVLRKTSMHFEQYDRKSPTIFDNLSPDYTQKFMKAIVAFEIEVTELENVFKLSQNRDEQSFNSIQEKLRAQGGQANDIAEEMEKRKTSLFPEDSKKEIE
jgi:transcriptional regulator